MHRVALFRGKKCAASTASHQSRSYTARPSRSHADAPPSPARSHAASRRRIRLFADAGFQASAPFLNPTRRLCGGSSGPCPTRSDQAARTQMHRRRQKTLAKPAICTSGYLMTQELGPRQPSVTKCAISAAVHHPLLQHGATLRWSFRHGASGLLAPRRSLSQASLRMTSYRRGVSGKWTAISHPLRRQSAARPVHPHAAYTVVASRPRIRKCTDAGYQAHGRLSPVHAPPARRTITPFSTRRDQAVRTQQAPSSPAGP